MTIRCAIIDLGANAVVNVVDYDAVPVGVPPGMSGNLIAVADNQASIGWKWNGASTVNPNQPPAPTAATLAAYAQAKQQAIAQGGFSVNANPSGAALNVSVDTSPTFLTYLSGTVQSAQLMLAGTIPTSNIDWFQDSGQIELTPQQAITVGALISQLIQQSFTTLGQIVAAINAGTITTTAQIDAPPAPIPAWPANN